MLSLQVPYPNPTLTPLHDLNIPYPWPCVRMMIMRLHHHHHHRHLVASFGTNSKKSRQQRKQNPPFLLQCCASTHPQSGQADQRRIELSEQRDRDEPQPPLPSGLQREFLPKHVAVIMDGNSRWARGRGLPTSAGHEAGYRSLKEIVALSCKWGIKALTVFAFSSENWLRPKKEIDFLMMLFENVLLDNLNDFLREGIRVCIIGDLSKLPKSLQKLAKDMEMSTRNNSRFDLIVAISYSGRGDIVQACQRIAQKVKEGFLEPAEVTESLIAQELETSCVTKFNYPDLLIRSSGELRLSNFLLWQSAYTELYFTKVHWPDFREADYIEALSSFQRRQRRFGQRMV